MVERGSCERGRTLIEVMGALGVMGIVMIAGLGVWHQVQSSMKVQVAVNDMMDTALKAKTFFRARGRKINHIMDCGGEKFQQDIYNKGITPKSWCRLRPEKPGAKVDCPEYFHALGGTAQVTTDRFRERVSIVYNSLSRKHCVALLTRGWESLFSSGLYSICSSQSETSPSSACGEGDSGSGRDGNPQWEGSCISRQGGDIRAGTSANSDMATKVNTLCGGSGSHFLQFNFDLRQGRGITRAEE